MNTVVCIKIIDGELNPFDAAGLEWAIRRRERVSAAGSPESERTTVLCMGPPSCEPVLQKTSRLGTFRTILISDPLYAGSDTLATSRVLAAAIRRISRETPDWPVDLVVCGRQSIDGDTAQVGPMLAQRLGFDLAANVLDATFLDATALDATDLDATDLDATVLDATVLDATAIPALRDGTGAQGSATENAESSPSEAPVRCVSVARQTVSVRTRLGNQNVSFPAVITVERIYNLRFPSIRSKAQPVEVWTNRDLRLDPTDCGLAGSPAEVLKVYESERGRRRCQFVSRAELEPLLERLKREPRKNGRLNDGRLNEPSNNKQSKSEQPDICRLQPGEKLNMGDVSSSSTAAREISDCPTVVAIGPEVCPAARELSKSVVVLDKGPVVELTRQILNLNPDIVLWNADLWGRQTAPQAAAALETGLCADCTRLESSGGKLYMYRPARGGNVTAKIECRTRPQMATVRTIAESTEIIVAAGRNMAADLPGIQSLADKWGAQMGASRGLVDTGAVPYDWQVGLTGRSVSPKIYLAIGISGAVQHTCAIENADWIIAVNPDRNARIFDYADFGVAEEF